MLMNATCTDYWTLNFKLLIHILIWLLTIVWFAGHVDPYIHVTCNLFQLSLNKSSYVLIT